MNIQDDTKAESSEKPEAPKREAERLEHELEDIREHLGGLVTELDHRRHRLNPVAIVKRDPWLFAIGGVVLAGAVVGGMAWRNARVHRLGSWEGRAKRRLATLRLATESQPNGNGAPALAAEFLRRLHQRLRLLSRGESRHDCLRAIHDRLPGPEIARQTPTWRKHTMLIRAGYEISIECNAETPLMALLSVHPSRYGDLRTPAMIGSHGASPRGRLFRRLGCK